MKKIFQIASYDFKRLLINPITVTTMIIVLIMCLIVGLSCNIPTSEKFEANIEGVTTKEYYRNFNEQSDNPDSKNSLKLYINDANSYIDVLSNPCQDSQDLLDIDTRFSTIKTELLKLQDPNMTNKYMSEQNIEEITSAVSLLNTFVNHFKSVAVFKTNVFFKKSSFEELETTLQRLTEILDNQPTINDKLYSLAENVGDFDIIRKLDFSIWNVDTQKLEEFSKNYIEKAEEKLTNIETEMNRIINETVDGNVKSLQSMKSLAASYKLTAQSVEYAVRNELNIMLDNHFGNLDNIYGFEKINEEETTLGIVKARHYINDENIYYTSAQQPLNFNMASYEVSAYDKTYFVVAIIGFIDVIFGIFCAYKLFGRDRRNGKMDVILSQNVTFGQVFIGKTLAIVFITSFMLGAYAIVSLLGALLFFPQLSGLILSVFNLSTVYTIHPFIFLVLKLLTIELQVIFYSVMTIFLMNISRRFELTFSIALIIFTIATVCNIFLNGSLIYCLFPFIHTDLSSMFASVGMKGNFLVTTMYRYGNFFISLAYYLVVVLILFFFTKQLFKKN